MDFTLADGTKLNMVFENCLGKRRGTVILVHGLAEHLGRYDHVARRLLAEGYAVVRYDQRGHGKSEGKRIYFDIPQRLFDDLYQVVQEVKKTVPDDKIFVLGHSMGGFTVAGLAVTHPGLVDGYILSGAMTQNSHKSLKPIPAWVPDGMRLRGDIVGLHAKFVSRDKKVVKAYRHDPLVEDFITMGLAKNFYEGVECIKTHVNQFQDPVLILHGTEDKLVPVEDSKILYAVIFSQDKKFIAYDGLYHELLNEPEKDQVLADIITWLNERTS